MPKPYPKEFREDVIRVARSREPRCRSADREGLRDLRVVSDNWLARRSTSRTAVRPGRDARASPPSCVRRSKRIRLLEQENEVLRRAAAYLSQANLPGK